MKTVLTFKLEENFEGIYPEEFDVADVLSFKDIIQEGNIIKMSLSFSIF